jgi:hypothetical protein
MHALLNVMITLGGACLGGFSGFIFAFLYLQGGTQLPGAGGGSFAPLTDGFYFFGYAILIGSFLGGLFGFCIRTYGVGSPDEDD